MWMLISDFKCDFSLRLPKKICPLNWSLNAQYTVIKFGFHQNKKVFKKIYTVTQTHTHIQKKRRQIRTWVFLPRNKNNIYRQITANSAGKKNESKIARMLFAIVIDSKDNVIVYMYDNVDIVLRGIIIVP